MLIFDGIGRFIALPRALRHLTFTVLDRTTTLFFDSTVDNYGWYTGVMKAIFT